MASKQSMKLLDLQAFIVRNSYKLSRFIKHNIFMQKYNVLILGSTNNSNFQHIHKYINNQKLTLITSQQAPNIPNQPYPISQIIINNHNYSQIEKQLRGQKFDSIVVLPQEQSNDNSFNIEEQAFGLKYPQVHMNELMMNMLAYRLAHKNLSKLGVVILGCNQNQFVKYKSTEKHSNSYASYTTDHLANNKDSSRILDGLIAYLGIIIGQRQHTNLNSSCLIVLKTTLFASYPQRVGKYYGEWIKGANLPHAGSFALLRQKVEQKHNMYVQYL